MKIETCVPPSSWARRSRLCTWASGTGSATAPAGHCTKWSPRPSVPPRLVSPPSRRSARPAGVHGLAGPRRGDAAPAAGPQRRLPRFRTHDDKAVPRRPLWREPTRRDMMQSWCFRSAPSARPVRQRPATGVWRGSMADQAEVTVAPPHDDLCAEVAACLGLPVVAMTVAPAGGAGHVAYEVHDPARPGAPVAFYRCESGFAGRRYGLRREAEILPVAAVLGWPVPLVLGTPGNPPGLLMNLIPGTSRPDPDEMESTAAEDLALVAAVHAAEPAPSPLEQYATMGEALSDDLGWWTAYAAERGALQEPLIRLAARGLAATLP